MDIWLRTLLERWALRIGMINATMQSMVAFLEGDEMPLLASQLEMNAMAYKDTYALLQDALKHDFTTDLVDAMRDASHPTFTPATPADWELGLLFLLNQNFKPRD